MLHPEIAPQQTKVYGILAHQFLHPFRQAVQTIQMQIGKEEDGVAVKGYGQVGEMKADAGSLELESVMLSPIVHAQQTQHGFHENMVIEGIFEIHKVTQEP